MKTLDFYCGFEGEPEIQILMKDINDVLVFELKTWIGYFNATLIKIPPTNGNWEGIALHYHLETGWYDIDWECDNLLLLKSQLLSIAKDDMELQEKKFLGAFIDLVLDASKNNHRLFIRYCL
jgi:hypothetical protein